VGDVTQSDDAGRYTDSRDRWTRLATGSISSLVQRWPVQLINISTRPILDDINRQAARALSTCPRDPVISISAADPITSSIFVHSILHAGLHSSPRDVLMTTTWHAVFYYVGTSKAPHAKCRLLVEPSPHSL